MRCSFVAPIVACVVAVVPRVTNARELDYRTVEGCPGQAEVAQEIDERARRQRHRHRSPVATVLLLGREAPHVGDVRPEVDAPTPRLRLPAPTLLRG